MKTIKVTKSTLITTAIALVISGCESTATQGPATTTASTEVTLPPADKPATDPVGTKFHTLRNGESIIYTVNSVKGDTHSGSGSNGCSYTELIWAYAPSLEWANCSGSTGTQTITSSKGSPWPMSVGTKFSYKFKGSDGSDSWKGYRNCKVVGTEHITTQMGEYDTYKIECKDPWSKRTWWYAPEIGRNVFSKRKHFSNSSRNYELETTKVVVPNS